MAQNYIQPGDVMPVTLGSAVTSGDVVVTGSLLGVALGSLDAEGGTVEVALCGVFELPKASGASTDFAQGAPLYWDDTNNVVAKTDNSGANKLLGYAFVAAGTSATKAQVLLSRP